MSWKEMVKRISIVIICLLAINGMKGQYRWEQSYLDGENPFGESLVEYYDKGYLLAGRFGPNYPTYCWLIKTDINGEELWRKVIGDHPKYIVVTADITYNNNGDIYLVGSTNYYNENDYDPLIMKLNSCGEKEWCKVFIEADLNFSNEVVAMPDGGCAAVLRYMNPDLQKDRICLVKLDSSGEIQWNQCYNSQDTSIYNEDAQDLIRTPDNGFLISGNCDYVDPNPPHYWWYKPYYIKTDSLGNFEWETIVHKEVSDKGGQAWTTVISPDTTYYYSSISHYYHPPYGDAAALLKMDFNGNVIDIYDLAPLNEYGKMVEAKFITDTTLAASAVWGATGPPKAVIIDTLGNILKQTTLLDNKWMGQIAITIDKKILYQTNLNEGDDFSTYLFKFNRELESDTVYTQYFNYDSLCVGEIVSDTIVQDDCGIIVGDVELYKPKKENRLLIYPNPAGERITVACPLFENENCKLEIIDQQGRKIAAVKVMKGESKISINTTGWPPGFYVVRIIGDAEVLSGKVVVRK